MWFKNSPPLSQSNALMVKGEKSTRESFLSFFPANSSASTRSAMKVGYEFCAPDLSWHVRFNEHAVTMSRMGTRILWLLWGLGAVGGGAAMLVMNIKSPDDSMWVSALLAIAIGMLAIFASICAKESAIPIGRSMKLGMALALPSLAILGAAHLLLVRLPPVVDWMLVSAAALGGILMYWQLP